MSSIVHFEYPAEDTARAKQFWSSLFGWDWSTWDGPAEYHMTQGIEPGGAIYRRQGGESGPTVYFSVDDMDAALDRVQKLGGSVETAKAPVPSMGWYAHCKDTEGNKFSIWQSDPSAPAPE